jgi:hypothetical protein
MLHEDVAHDESKCELTPAGHLRAAHQANDRWRSHSDLGNNALKNSCADGADCDGDQSVQVSAASLAPARDSRRGSACCDQCYGDGSHLLLSHRQHALSEIVHAHLPSDSTGCMMHNAARDLRDARLKNFLIAAIELKGLSRHRDRPCFGSAVPAPSPAIR